jgi:thiol-disulfide isomerase/thioredoxin
MSQTQMFDIGHVLQVSKLPLTNVVTSQDTMLELKGIRILNFWASWCKPCLNEMKSLGNLQKVYTEVDINLISFDDTINQKKAIVSNNIHLPAFFIKDTTIFNIPEILPRTIILKNNTVIRDMYIARDWTSVETTNMIDTILNKK